MRHAGDPDDTQPTEPEPGQHPAAQPETTPLNSITSTEWQPLPANLPRIELWKGFLFPRDHPASKPGLASFLERHRHLLGAWILVQLLNHPGQDFSPEQLDDPGAANPAANPVNLTPLLLESGIPYCDKQTLRQVRARITAVQSRLASPRCGKARAKLLTLELGQLQAYLRDCVAPGGKIRNFAPPSQKSGRSVRAALTRLLNAAGKEDPALRSYIASHLRMGKAFAWDPE